MITPAPYLPDSNKTKVMNKIPRQSQIMWAFLAAAIGQNVASYIIPLAFGAWQTELSITIEKATFLWTAEFGTATIGAMALAIFMSRVPSLRTVMLIAGVVTIVAQVGTIYSHTYSSILFWRFLAGVAGAFLNAALYTSAAAHKNADSIIARGAAVASVVAGLLLLGIPKLMETYGTNAIFISYVVVWVILLFGLNWTPTPSKMQEQIKTGERNIDSDNNADAAPVVSLGLPFRVLLVIASALVGLGLGTAWNMMYNVGTAVHASEKGIGIALMVMSFACVGGAVIADVAGAKKINRMIPLIGGLAICAAFTAIACFGGPVLYYVGFVVYAFFFFLPYPFCVGMGAQADSTGRMAALSGSAYIVSYALSAQVGGYLWVCSEALNWRPEIVIGAFCLIVSLLAIILFLVMAPSIKKLHVR